MNRLKRITLAALAAFAFAGPQVADAAPRVGKAAKASKTRAANTTRTSSRRKAPPKTRDVAKGTRLAAPKSKAEPTWRTAKQAAAQIKPGANVYIPIGHSVARSVLDALTARANGKSELTAKKPIRIVGLTNVASRKLYDNGGKIVPKSVFVGANTRDSIATGEGDFVPMHLSRVPRLIRDGTIKIDVAVVQVSPPDKNGYVSLGPTAAATLAAMEKAKTVIAEVNPNVPKTFGATRVHKSKINYMVRSNEPMITVPASKVTAVDKKIAAHVAKLIPKDPTLQFGIGATTDAVAGTLATSGRKDLQIHSEMISDGAMKLVESGAVKGKVKYSFALGTDKMLKWMDGNKKLEARPSDYTNDPVRLAGIKNLISINTALRVDLNGQINAQYIGGRFYSGVGGQQDFFRGAMMSQGGKAIMALPSTSTINGADGKPKLASRIVLRLGEGDITTTSMHDVQYVVTEYGVAHLEGKSMTQRAEALIKVSHPKFRKELRQELKAQMRARKSAVEQRNAQRASAKE